MTSTARSATASGGKARTVGRAPLTAAQRETAEAVRTARIATLHAQIGEQVQQLTADPAWRAMLEAAARFHTYSLNNQLLISLQAARLGFPATLVAGFGTWNALGRSVVNGTTGLAVLAPCTYRTAPPRRAAHRRAAHRQPGRRRRSRGGEGRRVRGSTCAAARGPCRWRATGRAGPADEGR